MQGEKFITATKDNKFHIDVRNLICPAGYYHMNNCMDYITLIRFIDLYNPEFIIIDVQTMEKDFYNTMETLEDNMPCPIIMVSNYMNPDLEMFLERSNILYFLTGAMDKNIIINTIKLSMLDFGRIKRLNEKLKNVSESYETRKLVERAKWVLVEQKGISENEAYERMRKKSMNTRIPMKEIAEAILFTFDMENEKKE